MRKLVGEGIEDDLGGLDELCWCVGVVVEEVFMGSV